MPILASAWQRADDAAACEPVTVAAPLRWPHHPRAVDAQDEVADLVHDSGVPVRVGARLLAVSRHTPADVIDAFMARASRVINSDLVDSSKAQLKAGFTLKVRVIGPGDVRVGYEAQNEYLVNGLAVRASALPAVG